MQHCKQQHAEVQNAPNDREDLHAVEFEPHHLNAAVKEERITHDV